MRVWGRIYDELGNPTWVEVSTAVNGLNDDVSLTWLIQVLKLNLGESPFYSNWGIPAYQTIMTQVFPDFYATQIQKQFAPYFASCLISRVPNVTAPTYSVKVVTNNGATIMAQVPT